MSRLAPIWTEHHRVLFSTMSLAGVLSFLMSIVLFMR